MKTDRTRQIDRGSDSLVKNSYLCSIPYAEDRPVNSDGVLELEPSNIALRQRRRQNMLAHESASQLTIYD